MIWEIEEYGIKSNANKDKIVKSINLVREMTNKVESYTKMLELAKKDRIDTVKECVRYLKFDENLLEVLKDWLNKVNKKEITRSKSCEGKSLNKYFINHLRGLFNNNSLKITDISSYGYEYFKYGIIFQVKDYDSVFELQIPIVHKLTDRNFEDAYYGNLTLLVRDPDNDWLWEVIGITYEESELKDILNEYLRTSNVQD